ncbi:MAG: organomercurial lyase [Halobacterium sp.]
MADDQPDAVEQSTTETADAGEQSTTDTADAAEQTTTDTADAHSEPVAATGTSDRWVESLDDRLPSDLRTALEQFLDADSVRTLGDWATEIRDLTGGGAIAVDDLCHTDRATAHYGEVDGERHYFACFYDAVVLAALTDSRVHVHTESPDGTVVEAVADEDGAVTASPPEAVFSLGVSERATPQDGGTVTHEDVYAAVCPYVRAFPDAAAYEDWAADAPAATVAVPFASAAAFSAALVE